MRYARISDGYKVLRDLWVNGYCFLVPSGPDREALQELLLERSPVLEERPRTLRWRDLYHLLAKEAARQGTGQVRKRLLDPSDRYLVTRWILKDLPKDGSPRGVMDPFFPALAAQQMAEFLQEEIKVGHLASANLCGGGQTPAGCHGCPVDSTGQVLCRLYGRYLEYLDVHCLADQAQLPTLAKELLTSLRSPMELKLAVVGFLSFTHGQLSLLRQLRDSGAELFFLFPWIDLPGFQDGSLQMGLDPGPPIGNTAAPPAFYLQGLDGHHQYELLARQLALIGADQSLIPWDGPLDQVAISVPAEDLRRLTGELWRYQVPFWVQGGSPLIDTVPLGMLQAAAEAAASGWDFQPAMRLISMVIRDLSEEDVMSLRPKGKDQWRRLLNHDPSKLKRLERLFSFGDLLLRGITPERLFRESAEIMDTLDPLEMSRQLGNAHQLDWAIKSITSVEEEARKKLFSLSHETSHMGGAFQDQLSISEAMQLISVWGRSSFTAQDQPLTGAVRIYRDQPPVLSEHGLFVLAGADQTRWPGNLRESPLVDDGFRRMVNRTFQDHPNLNPTHLMETHEKRVAKEAAFIRTALTGRDVFVMTKGAMDDRGRPVPPTPFVQSLNLLGSSVEDPSPSPSLLPKDSFVDGVEFPGDRRDWTPAQKPSQIFCVEIPPKDRKPKLPMSYLDSFAKCPFKYACQALLRLKEPQRDPVSPYLLGELLHRGIEMAIRERMGSSDEILEGLLKSQDASPLGEPRNMRHLKRLGDMLTRALEWLKMRDQRLSEKGFSLVKTLVETDVPELDRTSCRLVGRADLIDLIRHQSGGTGYVILDFKTGGGGNYKDSPQPAAYALAIRDGKLTDLLGAELWGFGFVSLGDMLSQYRWDCSTGASSGSKSQSKSLGTLWTSKDVAYHDLADAYMLYQPKERSSNPWAEDMISLAERILKDLDTAMGMGRFEARHQDYKIRMEVCPQCSFGWLCRRLEHQESRYDQGGEHCGE